MWEWERPSAEFTVHIVDVVFEIMGLLGCNSAAARMRADEKGRWGR